jgi:tRNA(fMet)-specific endonuclease VapC
MICLDTNVVISLVNRRNPRVRDRFEAQLAVGARLVVLPAVCLFELRYGYAKSDRRARSELQLEKLLSRGIVIAPLEADDAAHAGDIRAVLEAKGTPIGAYDSLIAGQTRSRGATLVTANTREFERVPGLLVVDWAA